MSDLDEVRGSPAPRPAELVRRLTRRASPTVGFVVYGVLYGLVVVNAVALIVLLAAILILVQVAGDPLPGWAKVATVAVWVAAFVGAWLPFAGWVRRRRGAVAAMVRDGSLIDGTVVAARRARMHGAPFTMGMVEIETEAGPRRMAVSFGAHRDDFVEGARQPVLHHPEAGLGLAFPIDGKAVAGRWKSPR